MRARAWDGDVYFVIGMHIIIGMPPHVIIIGAPIAIIAFMASQRSFMRDIIEVSVGIIFIIMPSFVISQDILHMIGIIVARELRRSSAACSASPRQTSAHSLARCR